MPCLLSRAIRTCPWCCIKACIFKMYPQIGYNTVLFFPSCRYCSATKFSNHLQLNFPQLKNCGGFQLLKSRASTRSKFLDIILCSQDRYTPDLRCNKELGVGAAVIYMRPVQKDIDQEVIIWLTLVSFCNFPFCL